MSLLNVFILFQNISIVKKNNKKTHIFCKTIASKYLYYGFETFTNNYK